MSFKLIFKDTGTTNTYIINTQAPKYQKTTINDIGTICSVCCESFKLNEFKRILECNHIYHGKCVDEWFRNNISCPICRREV